MAEPMVAVLAAGRGIRFGGVKLETNCAGKPVGRWAVEAVEAAGLGPAVIVTGPDGVSFAPRWTALVNPRPEQGLGASLALAARHALDSGADALLVVLADMPLLTPAFLRQLASSTSPIATRQPDGHAGVPALLGRGLMEHAAQLTGDRGAGALLAGATLLDPPPGMLSDVDTVEDLRNAQRALRQAQDEWG